MNLEVTSIREVPKRNPSHIISVVTFRELKSLVLPYNFDRNNWLHLNIKDVIDSNDFGGPTFYDMEKLFSWLNFKKNIKHLLIHCFEGRSRSPAVGLLVMAKNYGVKYSMKWLKENLPNSNPNMEIVRLGDNYLNFNGNLIQEIENFNFENFKKTFLFKNE